MAGSSPRSNSVPSSDGSISAPVEGGRGQRGLDLGPFQGRGAVVVEQSAVEPRHGLDAEAPARRHCPEQVAGQRGEFLGPLARLFQHAGEHVVGEQPHVLGEHAEHQPVDEVGDRVRVVAALLQGERQLGEGRRGALGQRLPAFPGPQPLRVRHRPFEQVAFRGVRQIVQCELVRPADAVGPIGADAEPRHVRDDQQRRILQRQCVLPELGEGGVEVGVLALVLPGEVVPLPHVGPAGGAAIFAGVALEAIMRAVRIGLRGRGLVQQPAQVEEMLLRGGDFLQRGSAPLGDEGCRSHSGQGLVMREVDRGRFSLFQGSGEKLEINGDERSFRGDDFQQGGVGQPEP